MRNLYIYLIENKINGKLYIGQRRCKCKPEEDIGYLGSGFLMLRAIKKYSKENFKKTILHKDIKTQDELNELEINEIKNYNTLAKNKQGYNLADGGHCGNGLAGFTDEQMKVRGAKISKANTGQKRSLEHCKAQSKRKLGKTLKKCKWKKVFSEEHKDKLKDSHKTRIYKKHKPHKKHAPCSEETKKNISEANKYNVPEFEGTLDIIIKKERPKRVDKNIFSTEHRNNISKAQKGKTWSKERKNKKSESSKGSGNSRWIEVDESKIDLIEKWYMEDKCNMKFIFEKTGLKTGKVTRLLESRGIITGYKDKRRYKYGE